MTIPQDRTLYLELAKLRPADRKWLFDNLKQVGRLLRKENEKGAVSPAPHESHA